MSDARSASDPRRSAWVSANAGAGKTYTLANRVTRQLLDKVKPERILCLTYTKAAAAEMQGRLFDQLGGWSMLDDKALGEKIVAIGAPTPDKEGLREARRLFAQALETPGGLKIQTIHSFCQYLLARFPLEAGVPPAFRVLDDQTARDLMAEARARVLDRAGRGEQALATATAHLVTQTSENRLHVTLEAALGGDRRKLERFLATLPDMDAMAQAIRAAHGAGAEETPESIAEEFCASVGGENCRKVVAWLLAGKKTDAERGRLLDRALGEKSFPLFRDAFLTAKGEPYKTLATKALLEADPALASALQVMADDFLTAEHRWRAAHAASLAEAALVLANAARGEYAALKRARGALDYDDLIASSLALLDKSEASAWVLYKLDGGLDHVLIDEAQDTSPEQWAIVKRLTEEFFTGESARADRVRTVFAVGDEKQSIFSFQGADPLEFEKSRQHFAKEATDGTHAFVDVRLDTSRRSAPEILEFVDRVFAGDEARAGVSSDIIRHEAHRKDAKGRVEFWPAFKPAPAAEPDYWRPVDRESEVSPVVKLAEQIAAQIKLWTDGETRLPGLDHPIRPGDIMILMPRREPFASEIIRRLKERGVPVAGADRIRLNDQIAVMDLVALGRFALLPEDDLNLAALLRSPLLDVSEEELFALARDRTGTLWRAVEEFGDGSPSITFAQYFLAECRRRADFAPPYEFYARALAADGMRKRLLARLGHEADDAIDEFLSLALSYEALNAPSLEGFLHWLEKGDAEIKRDMERGRNEVRVMTVHGAKGLEADIVILPDTTALPDGPGRRGDLLYTDQGPLFPVAGEIAPQAVRDAKDAAKAEMLKEHRRLLYVALTRARERLYVCGFENKKGVREGSWYELAKEAADALGIALKKGDEIRRVVGTADTEPATGEIAPARAARALPAWLRVKAKAEHARPRLIRPSEAAGLEEPSVLSPLGNPTRFARGLLIHDLLARLPEIEPAKRREAALSYLKARGGDAVLADETLKVLDDPAFADVFAPGSRAEIAIVADLPEIGHGARINGRIDRLAVNGDMVLAVDFKTNRPPPASPDQVSPVYLAQMALYRAALQKVFPGKRIATALVWTEGPRLMPLPDAVLEAEIGRIRARLDSRAAGS